MRSYGVHGGGLVAHRALEFPADTNPDCYGLKFRRDGIWCETRRMLERSELTELEWRLKREFIRGQIEGTRTK